MTVAADGDALGRTFFEFVDAGLGPEVRALGDERSGSEGYRKSGETRWDEREGRRKQPCALSLLKRGGAGRARPAIS